jgi:hypothetical protein
MRPRSATEGLRFGALLDEDDDAGADLDELGLGDDALATTRPSPSAMRERAPGGIELAAFLDASESSEVVAPDLGDLMSEGMVER